MKIIHCIEFARAMKLYMHNAFFWPNWQNFHFKLWFTYLYNLVFIIPFDSTVPYAPGVTELPFVVLCLDLLAWRFLGELLFKSFPLVSGTGFLKPNTWVSRLWSLIRRLSSLPRFRGYDSISSAHVGRPRPNVSGTNNIKKAPMKQMTAKIVPGSQL